MFAIIVTLAAAALPQATTGQTTMPQGNGHHANDMRRPESEARPSSPRRTKEKRRPDAKEQDKAPAPDETRDADGVLMPGAPGTSNPAIPGGSASSGG
ncbi:hypothetical protein [Sphingobium sp.]|uniref:hypothetical protein n=1 Tax=Sphingobium sp. TaxID=1912891 RepID=UPI003B3B05B7